MSEALYQLGGLRFWNETEIELREAFQAAAACQEFINPPYNNQLFSENLW